MKRTPILIVLFVAVAALFALFINNRLKFGGDAVDYIRLAESLRAGEGYTIDGRFHTKWPPVTPLVLAAGTVLFGSSVTAFKAIGAALGLAGLLAAYGLLRRRYEERLALLAVVLSAVMFPFIYWVVDVSSEAPFFCLTMVALLCAQRLTDDRPHWGWAVAAGVATGLAILTRMVGISLLAALALWGIAGWFRKTDPRPGQAALAVVVALVLAGAWFGYSRSQAGTTGFSSYGNLAGKSDIYETQPTAKSPVKLLAERTVANTVGYTFIFANPDSSLRIKAKSRLTPLGLVSAGIMLLAVAGFLYHLVKRPGLPEWYALSCGGLLLTYVWYDIRYVVPLFPLVFYYMIFSVDCIVGKLVKPALTPVVTGVAVGLFILANVGFALVGPQAKKLRSANYQGPAGELHEAALWIKANEPNAVVMCRWASMTWFWTRLKVEGVPLIADPDAMWQHMREKQVTIVIADPDQFSGITGKFLEPALTRHPQQVELIKTCGQTRVFRIRP